MPVYLDSIKFINPVTFSEVNWLLANVGDQIIIEHNISIKTFAIGNTETPLTLNNRDGFLDPGVISGFDFSKFKVGDVVKVYAYSTSTSFGEYTIVEVIDNTTIRLNTDVAGLTPPTDNVTANQIVISIVRPITALNYQWNFIENGEATNYFSKVDGTQHLAQITDLDPSGGGSGLPMTFIGEKAYQIGNITVDEVSLVTAPVYTSKFRITHTTRVTPFMLAEQWESIVSRIAPDYFFNLNCLKAIFFYEGRYDLDNPNENQTLEIDDTLGNTGWFDENWNTKLTKFLVEDLEYTDLALNPLIAPQLKVGDDGFGADTDDVTRFSFKVKSSPSNPFTNGDTRVTLNFCKAPNDAAEYSANGRDMLHNFVWESVSGSASTVVSFANGDNFLDNSIRSLKDVRFQFVDSTEIIVSGKLSFMQEGIDVFNESNEPRFMFFVSVQNNAATEGASNKTTLLLDAQPFFFQTEFADLVTIESRIIEHPVNDYLTLVEGFYTTFTEDELVGYSEIEVNPLRLGGDNTFQIVRISPKVIAYNLVNGEQFTLEQQNFNVAGSTYVGDLQYFNIVQDKAIHVNASEIRKKVICRFNSTSGKYELAYPYHNRWEYWVEKQGVNSDFFDTSAQFNGFNNQWERFNNDDWVIRYVTEVSVKYNGVPALYTDFVEYFIFGDDHKPSVTEATIQTFDPDSLSELTDGTDRFILGYKNTLVRATFTRLAGYFPTSLVTTVIGIEVYEEGGINGKTRMSSEYTNEGDTWFIPLTGETKVKNTFTSGDTICTAEALIDFSKLNLEKLNYKLSARIYEI